MQERRPPTRLAMLSARGEQLLGFLGILAVAATALNLEEVTMRTRDFPLSMGALLQATSEVGIHPNVTLTALGVIFAAGFIDGIHRNTR